MPDYYDPHLLQLENILKEKEDQDTKASIDILTSRIYAGEISLAHAQKKYKDMLSPEHIQQLFRLYHTLGDTLDIKLPVMLKAYLKSPFTHTCVVTLLREALQNGVLDTFSKKELSSILDCPVELIDTLLRNSQYPPTHVDQDTFMKKAPTLFDELMNDTAFEEKNFARKVDLVRALLRSPKYTHLRNIDIAGYCGASASMVCNERSLLSKNMNQEAPKKQVPKQEVPKQEVPKQSTKLETLLLYMYPQGIRSTEINNALVVVKHLKKAIKALDKKHRTDI